MISFQRQIVLAREDASRERGRSAYRAKSGPAHPATGHTFTSRSASCAAPQRVHSRWVSQL